MMTEQDICNFVKESNAIEKIFRDPTKEEINEFKRFISLSRITVEELEKFVSIYQPNAILRDQYDRDVQVGKGAWKYVPPLGSPEIRQKLKELLLQPYDAYTLHLHYEKLHPFTDCNGRSGRALWAWKRRDIAGGFLLNFYFEALQHADLY